VIDIPLLVEAPVFFDLLDAVLAISADEDARVSRLVAKGWDASDVRARIAVQASDVERRDIAEYVVENDGTLVEFESELRAFWERVVESRGA
jgi:dephospho-CoA kinase